MTPTDPEPTGQIDQHQQQIYGPQTNIAGGHHIHHHYGEATPPPLRTRCDFYRHIPLAANYIPRPELLAAIRATLLTTTTNVALTSTVRQADALFGMGGIGKSVIARALCDDETIQTAFPHGILWATLGQTPDLLARLRDWIYTLGGSVPPTALTPDALTNILDQTLQDRRCLLIIDDVWAPTHLAHFLVDRPGCRLLFTTRNADVATEVEATIHPIPVMSPDQAINLLVEWAGAELTAAPVTLQATIVERLGYLPLAIKLAGDQLRRHTPTTWLATFDAHKLAKHRPANPHDSLATTFALSLDDLTADERRLFNALAIFPDDETIPQAAIARLWSALAAYTMHTTIDLLHYLADRALLQRTTAQPPAPGAPLSVTLHDLIRDFMRAELGPDGHHTAHLALLAAYRPQRRAGWSTVPDDGYLYDHLVYHLSQIAPQTPTAYTELGNLFATQEWLHARVPAAGYRYDGYLRDLETSWAIHDSTSRQKSTTIDLTQNLTTHLRFALVRTSINSLAANYSPSLVGYAIKLDLWPVARALSIFAQAPDSLHKTQLGCSLLATGHLTPSEQASLLQQTSVIAATIIPADTRLRLLVAHPVDQLGAYAVHSLDTRTGPNFPISSAVYTIPRCYNRVHQKFDRHSATSYCRHEFYASRPNVAGRNLPSFTHDLGQRP